MIQSETDFARDIADVQAIGQVPIILDICSRVTGMRFCAIARVTEERWITCAALDTLNFGLKPGDELPIETTICNEIRHKRSLVVFDDAACDDTYRDHHTPRLYGLRSYISVPIFLKTGELFGTLSAIDTEPRRINTPENIAMFKLFADLLAGQMMTHDLLERSTRELHGERNEARLLEQFMAVVGHDLRNPIAALGAGVRMLQTTTSQPKRTLILAEMSRTVDRAGAIIEDLQDFARGRIGSGIPARMQDDVRVGDLIGHIAGEIASVSGEVFDIDCDMHLTMRCDPQLLGRLVSNLLQNAVKHGAAGAKVAVAARRLNGQFALAVTNSGETIPPEILPFLFQPFLRGNASGSEGLGLGLYIADQIAQVHGGTITAQSADGVTTFQFTMPIA